MKSVEQLRHVSDVLTNRDRLLTMLDRRGIIPHMSDEEYLRRMWRWKMGYELNLDNPRTFNEKLQWLKLYDRRPEYTVMADKVRPRTM